MIFIRSIRTILTAVTQIMGTCAIVVIALELPNMTVSVGACGWFIRAIPTISLPITFPPDRDAPRNETIILVRQWHLSVLGWGNEGNTDRWGSGLSGRKAWMEVQVSITGEGEPWALWAWGSPKPRTSHEKHHYLTHSLMCHSHPHSHPHSMLWSVTDRLTFHYLHTGIGCWSTWVDNKLCCHTAPP